MSRFDSIESLLSQGQIIADLSQKGNTCSALMMNIQDKLYFVKYAHQPAGRQALRRVHRLHTQVQDPVIWPLFQFADTDTQTILIYPWCSGKSLYQPAPERDQKDSCLNVFRNLNLDWRLNFLTQIYLAHLKISAAGWIMVDFYDGSLLYDGDILAIHLIDLDEYRQGAFVLETERLPGSLRFMAPEEFEQGSIIDACTNVFTLGACAREFLKPEIQAQKIKPALSAVIQQACHQNRPERFQSIAEFVNAWQGACQR